MAPTVGLNPTTTQKLDGRRIEPTTRGSHGAGLDRPPCVPSAAGAIPVAPAAAEPLLEPPGVRRGSCGLRVPRGCVAANSVVTVLPTITAPAARKAWTDAASRSPRQPANKGEPIWVGIS